MGNCCGTKRASNNELAKKYNLSLEQVNQYEKLFKEIDSSGDGKITADELGLAMKRLIGQTHSKQALSAMIVANDKNGSGNLDFCEFLSLLSSMNKSKEQKASINTEKRAMDAFAVFDKDGDGTITVTELRDTLKTLGINVTDAEAKRMVDDVDENKDGLISKTEFITMYRQICSEKSTDTL